MKDKRDSLNCVVSVNNLSKKYHDLNGEITALNNINFDVYDKEFISIVGPSGCGKSTLLSVLFGLEDKSGGKIIINNNKIGYMLQQDSLFPWRTVLDNCMIGLEITNTLNEKSKKNVLRLLKTYGLEDFMYKYPSSLSGGMKQRVE